MKKNKVRKENKVMTTKTAEKTERRVFSAKKKCEAVLSVWSERRKPHEVQKELGINYAMLSHWQDRALSAMLTSLEPKVAKGEDKGPALGPKLEKLLQRKMRQREANLSKVEQRLMKIQGSKEKAGKQ